MKLNKYTYKQIQEIRDKLCMMNYTDEIGKIFFILGLVKESSSYAYKELLQAELKKELNKLEL